MKTPILLSLACLAAGAGTPPAVAERSEPPTVTSALAASTAGEFEDLSAEFELATDEWRRARRAAEDSAERRRLRKADPTIDFWPRFEALAAAGEGRAELWMLAHLRGNGLRAREVRAETVRRHALLLEKYIGADWFGEVVERIDRDERVLGEDTVLASYERVLEKNESSDVRSVAMYKLAEVLSRSEDEERKEAGARWMARLAEQYPDTEYGIRAERELFVVRHLSVGREAPEFDAKTIDGHPFKLSDYRGKVVMLDFYGFW